jgi:hypothetical protein
LSIDSHKKHTLDAENICMVYQIFPQSGVKEHLFLESARFFDSDTLDEQSSGTDMANCNFIKVILGQNPVLQEYVREKISDTVEKLEYRLIGSTDTGMNLAIMNAHGISAQPVKWEVLRHTYQVTKLSQFTVRYHQLVYPLIFWNRKGDCGIIEAEELKKCTTRIRKVPDCLMFRSRDQFTHTMETLREEFICIVSRRLVNIALT